MKALRVFLILLVSLVLVLLVFRKPIKAYVQAKIQARLLEYINTAPDRLYDYAVGSMDIAIMGGNASLTNVKVHPRAGALDTLKMARIGSLLEAEVDSIALNGLGLYDLFVNGSIRINRILVGDVRFKYLTNSAYVRPDSIAKKPFVLRDVFSEELKKALVRRVELRNIDVFVDDIHTEEPFTTRFDSAQMLLREIYTDEQVMTGAQPFTYASLEMSALHFASTIVKDHTIRVESFSLNTEKEAVVLSGASFAPTQFDFKDQSKQFIRSVNAISADQVHLRGINFDSWQTDSRLEIRRVDISRPEIKISMDHHWPKPMHERSFIQAKVKSIPFPVRIDTVAAQGGQVFYRELFVDGKPPLILTFDDVVASVTNITNDTALLRTDPEIVFNVGCKLLNAGQVRMNTRFIMDDPQESCHLTFSLDNMALSSMNPILEGQVHARMEGQLNKLAMNVKANQQGAQGDFVFDYTGLKVLFFKEKETKHGTRERKNWIVNALVNPILKTDNHVSEKDFKGGNINYVRPPDISFFGMIWHCLKEGMVTTLIPGQGEGKGGSSEKSGKKKRSNNKEER